MKVKFIKQEDFLNYKKPSMFIGTCFCSFKCEKECPECHCQNSSVAKLPIVEIADDKIVDMYLNNDITHAIVFGGLEPFDQEEELLHLISCFREKTDDDIVIYTGYKEDEVDLRLFYRFDNIIVKFGRYVPNGTAHFDAVLGVSLASDNQYGKIVC